MKENRSVVRLLAILELIAKHDEGLTLGQIYRMLDIPKATVYDFLQTLYKADAIYYKDPRLKNYVIGSKMFAIGSVYTKNSSLIESGEYELKQFANKHGRTIFITKRIIDKIVYVYKYQPNNSKVVTPEVIGSMTRDFECSAIGKCYAVFDQKVLNTELKGYDEIKKNGYVFSHLDESAHLNTIATPVYNFENRVVGVISAKDLAVDDDNQEKLSKEFVEIAQRISRKLGYIGNFNV